MLDGRQHAQRVAELPAYPLRVVAMADVQDQPPPADAPRLDEYTPARVPIQVKQESNGEDRVAGAVGERNRRRIALENRKARERLAASDAQHFEGDVGAPGANPALGEERR